MVDFCQTLLSGDLGFFGLTVMPGPATWAQRAHLAASNAAWARSSRQRKPPTGQFRMREGVSLEKSGTLHRVPVARKGQPARPTMARDPARCRRRYRSAALARLDWNDIYSCPAETSVDLFSACNVRSPSVMASCLERNVSDERATSIAASPLQISHPNGRPGGPRRLVTSRNGDALSMPASMPASKASTVPRARDGKECQWRWILNGFTANPLRSRANLR